LLADLIVAPAGRVEFRQDVLSAGVGLGDHWKCLHWKVAPDSKRFDSGLPRD
jgi:hypothetical protein